MILTMPDTMVEFVRSIGNRMNETAFRKSCLASQELKVDVVPSYSMASVLQLAETKKIWHLRRLVHPRYTKSFHAQHRSL